MQLATIEGLGQKVDDSRVAGLGAVDVDLCAAKKHETRHKDDERCHLQQISHRKSLAASVWSTTRSDPFENVQRRYQGELSGALWTPFCVRFLSLVFPRHVGVWLD